MAVAYIKNLDSRTHTWVYDADPTKGIRTTYGSPPTLFVGDAVGHHDIIISRMNPYTANTTGDIIQACKLQHQNESLQLYVHTVIPNEGLSSGHKYFEITDTTLFLNNYY